MCAQEIEQLPGSVLVAAGTHWQTLESSAGAAPLQVQRGPAQHGARRQGRPDQGGCGAVDERTCVVFVAGLYVVEDL